MRQTPRIFDSAARENWLVMAQHFPPFPSLGHIRKTEQGWLWLPAVERPVPGIR